MFAVTTGNINKNCFRYFVGSEVHLQCDVAQCQGICAEDVCPGDIITASAIKGTKPGNKEDGSTLAATTVFVLDPADAPCKCFPFE